MCAEGQSFAHGWELRQPPCRSPPIGCPASALPSTRSQTAPHLPRCPQSWHGNRAVRGCSDAELSLTSRNLWWWSGTIIKINMFIIYNKSTWRIQTQWQQDFRNTSVENKVQHRKWTVDCTQSHWGNRKQARDGQRRTGSWVLTTSYSKLKRNLCFIFKLKNFNIAL